MSADRINSVCTPISPPHLYAQHLVLQVQIEGTEAGDVLLPAQLLHIALREGLAAGGQEAGAGRAGGRDGQRP